MNPQTFCFVSCDIVGHGFKNPVPIQHKRIAELNKIIRESLEREPGRAIWASGGDGGHVAFATPGCGSAAVELIVQLHSWAISEDVPLRITGHLGPAVSTEGADGRQQLVGDGINLCGSLLNFGSPKSIVTTESFRDFIETEHLSGVTFKDERTLYLKHFTVQRLFLMDVLPDVVSNWGEPSKTEYRFIDEALQTRVPLNVIYHAKRLLQTNTDDTRAREALEAVALQQAGQILMKSRFTDELEPNHFLSSLDPTTFFNFAKTAELVERDDGEFFCHYDDAGDTMFLVLTGEVGVVAGSGDQALAPRAQLRDFRFGPGQMVGELAYALRRSRTAGLQAIGPTAVLAFTYQRLNEVLTRPSAGKQLRPVLQAFLVARTLEHLCHYSPYLIGRDESGPLAKVKHPWRYMEGGHAEALHFSSEDTRRISTADPRFEQNGLYILASGDLVREPVGGATAASLDGRRLPILYVDFPNSLVRMHHDYRLTSEHAVVVRIGYDAFRNMRLPDAGGLVLALKHALARQFKFDVFLAYNSGDRDTATRWFEGLSSAGLSVYMNVPEGGQDFKPEIVTAILDSSVLMPLVSSNVTAGAKGRARTHDASWVHREVRLRRTMFDVGLANILPIQFAGGNVPALVEGITPIDVGRDALEKAIERAVQRVREIQRGSNPIPTASRRTKVPAEFVVS